MLRDTLLSAGAASAIVTLLAIALVAWSFVLEQREKRHMYEQSKRAASEFEQIAHIRRFDAADREYGTSSVHALSRRRSRRRVASA